MNIRTVAFLAIAATALADVDVHLKDGRRLVAKALRRDRDQIVLTLPTPPKEPNGKPGTGDFGFPLSNVFKLDFPKPGTLYTATDLIASGKADEALKQLEPVVAYFAGFRDAPGSWWVDSALLKIQALLMLKREKEGIDLAESVARLAENPENQKLSRAFIALGLTIKGSHESAIPLYDEAARNTKRLEVQGLIAFGRGESLTAIGDKQKAAGEIEKAAVSYEQALLSFLRVPALYPSQRCYLPRVNYGAARAYLGIEDFARARTSLKELKEQFPDSPEAQLADQLAAEVDKREKQLADPQAKEAEKPAA
jgi:tetratricopeptide (TPR) repeat protein